jgi:hypothetical protein
MANYYGVGRTNFFQVKDPNAFEAEMKKYGLRVKLDDDFAMLISENEGGFEWSYQDDETDLDIDYSDVFRRHLVDGAVAVIMEVGNEKLNYLGGYAVAYNNKGESREVSISDIFTLAKELGNNIISFSSF